jgi:solute carrier family 25 (mitochondrial aspartate/glutamate transporter), member 12/13
MATVTESIKQSLVGTIGEPPLSQEVRANFLRYAKPDENGELYMGSEEFINAVAPAEEDYVSYTSIFARSISPSWAVWMYILVHY